MEKTQRLQEGIRRHGVPETTAERLTATAVSAPHFAFRAFRIGNSVGDAFDTAMSYLLAEAIADSCNVILYTVEHCELHSRGGSPEALDDLIRAALAFDSALLDARYRSLLGELRAGDYQEIRERLVAVGMLPVGRASAPYGG